jgi:hypothetical protein
MACALLRPPVRLPTVLGAVRETRVSMARKTNPVGGAAQRASNATPMKGVQGAAAPCDPFRIRDALAKTDARTAVATQTECVCRVITRTLVASKVPPARPAASLAFSTSASEQPHRPLGRRDTRCARTHPVAPRGSIRAFNPNIAALAKNKNKKKKKNPANREPGLTRFTETETENGEEERRDGRSR